MACFPNEAPLPGVLDTWSAEELLGLIEEGWQRVPHAPSDLVLRKGARRAVLEALEMEADCLSVREHELIVRLLIAGEKVPLMDVEDVEAALALRYRLWCDVGIVGGEAVALLDPQLAEPLQQAMARPAHQEIRARIFSFQAMLHAMLYMSGFLDDRLPRQRFIADVLRGQGDHALQDRLSRNYLEASFDCILLPQCRLLVHSALSDPEGLVEAMAMHGALQTPDLTPAQMLGCMNGLLPEEETSAQAMAMVLQDALRPEIACDEAVEDLRMLIKQGAPPSALKEALAAMLCVLPTKGMLDILEQLRVETVRWVPRVAAQPVAHAMPMHSFGLLH